MRDWFGATARIGVSKTGIAVLRISGAQRRTNILADHPMVNGESDNPERLAIQLRTVMLEAGVSAMPTTVIVADDWCRFFMITPPRNTVRLQDCQAAAAMRFEALYGEPSHDWQLVADWDAVHPFLACAMPQVLLTMLRQVALERKLRLIAIAPQFIAAWNRWRGSLKSKAWFGCVNQHVFSLGAIAHERVCAVRVAVLPADAHDRRWLQTHVTHEALRLNLAMPGHIQLCGNTRDFASDDTTRADAGALACSRLEGPRAVLDDGTVSGALQLARTGMRA